MQIQLFNTLSKKKEVFQPLDASHIRMYVCGPTVYDRAHIGNARAMVIFDSWHRLLRQNFQKVTYVRNITDVDDKINNAAKEQNIAISTLTDRTTRMFHEDMAALFCLSPDIEPTATAHIPQMIRMIEQLIANNHAYAAEGHVLFSVGSDPHYGHLSNRSKKEMIAGARVEVAPYKKEPGDFVLWKPSREDEPGWDSPWGYGRPGWHIECSAMSTEYLGPDFDIHGGGADLQFPHHENEITQSCGANPGSHFARYWLHNGFLTVNGEKMSKSLGNFITVHDLLAKGIKGQVIRLALLSTHYRKPLDFSEKLLEDAKKTLDSFYRALEGIELPAPAPHSSVLSALADDLNIPQAIAEMHGLATLAHKAAPAEKAKLAGELFASGKLLGLFSDPVSSWFDSVVDERITKLITERSQARKNKNWKESDRLRDLLAEAGIVLEDKPDGTTVWRKV